MSGNNSQAAADRIKAWAVSNAKGLSRAQAERAAEAAARNVNAYGQKEEGPSHWQERKEAKRKMYLMSTEQPVRLGVRPNAVPTSSSGRQCQKCFQPGHWTYECRNERVYISRPSRTEQLKNPRLKKKVSLPACSQFVNPDLEKEMRLFFQYPMQEETKLTGAKQKNEKSERKKVKSNRKFANISNRKHRASVSHTDPDSESSASGCEYSSESSSSSYSSLDSEDRNHRCKAKQKKRRHQRDNTSSSSSSESESESKLDSDEKGKKRGYKRRV
ncbi:zinc finger CCHC domain-containing protein 10 [Triticum aestivum]|uniref:zinc finger CCHC domain-containing protein 10 n=1 Tax=Triticum aestivum TaxID=4565 RepID=UPI001D01C82A|nr:zinc finger CCHC domain-containing protein 10-like [Triticum aestivum]